MKKVFFASLLVALLCAVVNVSAMTEAELKKKLENASVKVGDTTLLLTAGEKKAIADYLDAHELSSADCEYISAQVDKAIEIVKAEGKENLKDMSKTAKENLKKLVTNIDANTSVKATVTNGSVVVLNDDNTTFFEADKLVKQTGSENSNIAIIAGVSFVITLVGACLVVRQVKNN